ncbi:DUF4199 domain-containing protein [Bacteroides sp. 51]|uniref:DUF4199 domain-containing protein n=1 Tax=Bacteroides sp. 51 TaxID=2302938 RepID=UPI0013D55FD4|nr:DUF4199 domain-containing protein [Bacteroides sp. 51]NDV80940.1 DUF4199 domain-containing protein [Bacteroides sp. 51]
MAENRINLQRYAMHFGTYMGVYWIAKFALFPMGLSNSFLMLLFFTLTIAVPFMGYYYARTFREKICGGNITFMQSWLFMVFMYLFASLLTAVGHYIYFRFIDHGYMMDTYSALLEEAKSVPGFETMMEPYNLPDIINLIRSMSAIEIAMQLLSQNMLYCSILALITAPFVAKKKQVIS